MGSPFASEPNSISNSVRFSASIRPLTVKVTSPFADLVILSIFVSIRYFALRGGRVALLRYGNHDSNCKLINIEALGAGEMSEFRQLLKFPQQAQKRLFSADG